MCKYCSKVFSGDYDDDLIEIEIAMNELTMFGIQTYIESSDNGNVYLSSHLHDEHGRYVAKKSTEIQYCPICGRKLTRKP